MSSAKYFDVIPPCPGCAFKVATFFSEQGQPIANVMHATALSANLFRVDVPTVAAAARTAMLSWGNDGTSMDQKVVQDSTGWHVAPQSLAPAAE
jgi:hypothetical protein